MKATFSIQIFSSSSANRVGLKSFHDTKAWSCTEFNHVPSGSKTDAFRIKTSNESHSGTLLEKLVSTTTEENASSGSKTMVFSQRWCLGTFFLQHVVHRIDPHLILDGPNTKDQQGHHWETLVETKNHKLKSYRARSVTETRAVDEDEGLAQPQGPGWPSTPLTETS